MAELNANETTASDNLLGPLHKGAKLIKIKSSRKYPKRYQLEKTNDHITYSPSKKKIAESKISISDIKEVRTGKSTDTFKSANVKKISPNHCFSLVIGNNNETVDLVALSEEEALVWVKGIRHLKKQGKHIDVKANRDKWIRDFFKKADRNGDGSLDFEEICKLLNSMNLKVDKRHVRRIFQAADTHVGTKAGGESAVNELDVEEFVEFYKKITARDEIVSLFYKYSGDDDYWEADEFLTFMQQEQKRHELHSKWCEKVILKYEQTPELIANEVMSLDAFNLFMLGPNGMVMNPYHDSVYQDMTQPLSHYFIASSHNTYLLEDQLKGPSSTEAYIRALQLGCRCVELDCWDGSDGEPIIYHGHTLTSKIKFKDVIDVINRYSFEVSEYPVIVSLENHCSVEQQKRMADYMGKIFGDKLYMKPVTADMKALPSPEQLKHKIIIKGKKLKVGAGVEGNVSDEDEADELVDEDKQQQQQQQQQQEAAKKKKKKKKQELAKELSDQVVLCKSVHFKDFQSSKSSYTFYEMSSFGESKAMDLSKQEGRGYVEHNKFQLSRTYPGGKRTNSSNYMPFPLWNAGCQIVALNYQTPCDEMDINLGRFRQNGNCGYVLKPVWQRKESLHFDPEKPGDRMKQRLTIKIISGQQLPKPAGSKEIIDPYVKINTYGVPSDCFDVKTKVIDNNGFNPFWNEKKEFEIKVPELCIVRFVVRDFDRASSNEFIGQYCLPMTSMQQGYHHVPLLSKSQDSLAPASIFVHISISETGKK